jgi:hypothetical protein
MKSANRINTQRGRLPSLVIVLAAIIGTGVPALALTPITTCGFVISQGGNYVVNADLLGCTGDGIDVNVSSVSLNLNGHKITAGTPAGGYVYAGINVNTLEKGPADAINHVAITGPGLIQNFFIGINMIYCNYCQVALVTAAHNGDGLFSAGTNSLTVGSNVFVANFGAGLIAGASINGTFSQNDLSGNGTQGLALVNNGGASVGNTVNNNTADGNAQNGIDIEANNSRVYSNVTNGNGGTAGTGGAVGAAGILIVLGSTGNQVFNNSSSRGNGSFDLQDQNAACGSDFWSSNVFFTSNASCIH